LTRRQIRIGARRVTYREAGSGAAVVVASGLGLSGRFYDRSFAAFADAGLRLIVPDLPCFGGTPGPVLGQHVPETRAFLLSFVDALGVDRAIWVGHSVGAQVTIDLAAEAPHRTNGLVLVGPTGSPGARKLPRQAWALVREALRAPFPVVLRVLSDYVRISPLAYVGTWVRYGRDTPLEKLRAVSCPALVLVGTRDPVIDPLFLEVLLRRLPAARLERVPGGSHALPRAHAERFNALVVRFCRELQEAAR
jgi:pimeloyl-ACP methyl ester carboxylesterase